MSVNKYQGVLKGKVILLNSPKGAGKDYLASRLCELTGCHHGQFKEHLYLITSILFNIRVQDFIKIATDRDTKEKEFPVLGNISPRQALIAVSEGMIKPNFGKAYFGTIEAAKLPNRMDTGVTYSDSGFIEEAQPLIEVAGAENVFIIKFTRKGADSFEGDSRNWLPSIEGTKVLKTANNGTIDELAIRVLDFVKRDGESIY